MALIRLLSFEDGPTVNRAILQLVFKNSNPNVFFEDIIRVTKNKRKKPNVEIFLIKITFDTKNSFQVFEVKKHKEHYSILKVLLN